MKPQAEDYFLEIGPGDGALTEKILPNVHSMTSIEIDPLLVKSLSNNSQLKDLSIIQDDILNIDIEDLSMIKPCLLYTSPSPRDQRGSRMPSSA